MSNTCRICGCTDDNACFRDVEGRIFTCSWIEDDLCSFCVNLTQLMNPQDNPLSQLTRAQRVQSAVGRVRQSLAASPAEAVLLRVMDEAEADAISRELSEDERRSVQYLWIEATQWGQKGGHA